MTLIIAYPSIPTPDRYPPLPRVIMVASRDILPGQELCFDYLAAYFISRNMACFCYTPICLIPPCMCFFVFLNAP